jgi:4-amino-4-deoxy-L-arabinose transferase-like glycosyltransferase
MFTTLHYSNKTFIDWISFNIKTNTTEKFHSLYYFSLTELATFHILWLYAILGIFYLIKNNLYKEKKNILLWSSIVLGTLPVLFWPLFYVRIFYIQFVVIVPLALLGITYITDKYRNPSVINFLVFIPIAISGILFSIAGNSSLFDLLSYAVSFIK